MSAVKILVMVMEEGKKIKVDIKLKENKPVSEPVPVMEIKENKEPIIEPPMPVMENKEPIVEPKPKVTLPWNRKVMMEVFRRSIIPPS